MKKQNKKYRKLNLVGFTIMFALFSASFYLATTLFLRTKNNTLSAQKQNIERQIAQIQTQNDAIKVEIQTLSSSDRVDEIAAGSGMSRNQNNVITITDGSQDGE